MITSEIENQSVENPRLIRRKEVQVKTGLGASSIYALMKKGDFPQSLHVSIRRVAWIESEVDQWISDRIASHKTTNVMVDDQTQVLNYLKSGKTLSQTEARSNFNCYDLSAVIECLRNIGYDIVMHSESNANSNGMHARYELKEVQA